MFYNVPHVTNFSNTFHHCWPSFHYWRSLHIVVEVCIIGEVYVLLLNFGLSATFTVSPFTENNMIKLSKHNTMVAPLLFRRFALNVEML